MAIRLKTIQEIQTLREGGKRLGGILRHLGELAVPGATTADLDEAARELIRREGGTPSFLGYHDFPAAVCTSVNHGVVHGLPQKDIVLNEGDIVGIDIGMWYEGFCTDTAITVAVGAVSDEVQQLLSVTKESMIAGIRKAVAGNHIGDIGYAIQSTIEPHGYGIVRDLIGHGVGHKVHEEPQVPNFGRPGRGPHIQEGLVIAIEPMVNLGTHEVQLSRDGWTYETKDQKLAAHFEHTIAVTPDGPLVVTLPPGEQLL